jgi:predicted transcriptional regulator
MRYIAGMGSRPTKRTAPFSMRLEPDLKAALERLAEAENRNLTNYVETALRQHVAQAEKAKTRTPARAT